MHEASKAMRRRYIEDHTRVFPWMKLFQGDGIDLGCSDDKLPFDNCKGFDLENGDANYLTDYFAERQFDYLHASQCLEHMHDPGEAIAHWIQVVKPGGHLIISVPDWCLYERMIWPSRFNPDHKSTWSMWIKDSPAPHHIHVPSFLELVELMNIETLRCELIDTNYDYKMCQETDQTLHESDGVEAFIEFVLKKH